MAETNQEKHEEAYRMAEERVREQDPAETAQRAGARWIAEDHEESAPEGRPEGRLEMPTLDQTLTVSWPDLTMSSTSAALLSFPWRLMTLHYLSEVTDTEPGLEWIGYRELPDGLFYANTVTREVEVPLAGRYGDSPDAFAEAAEGLGGTVVELADTAYAFRPFPRVPVVIALWLEDEEFPAKAKVLYEKTGASNLPLQDLRIVAEILGHMLLG